jgi:TonB family protein
MSTPTELWKKWEGRVVDGKFPLRRRLGGTDHSAVFLTERTSGSQSQKVALKLISTQNLHQENLDEAGQLSRWATAARLSRPHLIRLFEYGRCQIDDTRLLYVVMDYAEENLSEILPLRPLTPEEASEMLLPAAAALGSLHNAGFVHGRIKPSNILAVDNQLKISSDGLRKTGERYDGRATTAYDAPEVATTGLSPAADIWSLGMTLLAVLNQKEPKPTSGEREAVTVPETIPQPLRGILAQCLQVDPRRRCTVGDILSRLQPKTLEEAPVVAKLVEAHLRRERRTKRIVVPIAVVVALFLVVWVGNRLMNRQSPLPAAESQPAQNQPTQSQPAQSQPVQSQPVQSQPAQSQPVQAPAAVPTPQPPAAQSPAPFFAKEKPAKTGLVRGAVLEQVLPDVPRSAQNTIEGRVKVSVQVSVDSSGKVSDATLASAGPSKYFAKLALAAARRWKFTPPQVDGQPVASEWVLRFQFKPTTTQVSPAETKP